MWELSRHEKYDTIKETMGVHETCDVLKTIKSDICVKYDDTLADLESCRKETAIDLAITIIESVIEGNGNFWTEVAAHE